MKSKCNLLFYKEVLFKSKVFHSKSVITGDVFDL